ncbi:mechanosensitive ion channel protein, partial [Salmonella enterica subsp. enterica serovar Typhi]|nr:mechanosensitive ion channel protein [Salmonella enterica subsp. enterica serovar Typhi]
MEAQAQDAVEAVKTQAAGAIDALQSGWSSLAALAVTYSLSVLGAIILLIIGYLVAGVIERAVYGALRRIPGFDETLCRFFSRIARYFVLALVLVMVLGQFGVQTASIIAAIGAVGLAVGLALQGTLQNIAAGIMLLVLRPFRVGESIEVGAISGTIEEIGLFATRLKTADGIFLLTPNSKLWDQPVLNYSRNAIRRGTVSLPITYEANLDLAQNTLVELADRDKRVLKSPAANARVTALGDKRV